MSDPLVSLCHASRRIPGWEDACLAWLKTCSEPSRVEYILGVDATTMIKIKDDGGYRVDMFYNPWPTWEVAFNRGRECAVDAWNATAKRARGKLLITVSDDYTPPEYWDTKLLKCIPDLDGEYVLDVDNQDGAVGMLPFSFLTRAYMDRLIRERGYAGFFYPEFYGMAADVDYYQCARRDDVIINCKHLKFTHLNPDAGTAPWDETYKWQRREEAQEVGRRVLARRERDGFRK